MFFGPKFLMIFVKDLVSKSKNGQEFLAIIHFAKLVLAIQFELCSNNSLLMRPDACIFQDS